MSVYYRAADYIAHSDQYLYRLQMVEDISFE